MILTAVNKERKEINFKEVIVSVFMFLLDTNKII
jgi:hypothetical protein